MMPKSSPNFARYAAAWASINTCVEAARAKPVASCSRILAVYAATSGGPITGTRFAVRGGSTGRCLGTVK